MGFTKTSGVNKFRILADTPTATPLAYKRGDLVHGHVYLQCTSAVKFRLISIQLVGSVVYWSPDRKVRRVDKVVHMVSYLKTAPGVGDVYVTESNGKREMTKEVGLLPEGEYNLPFAIQLPDNALPTVAAWGPVGVEYKLIATLDSQTEELEIFVSSSMNPEQFSIEGSAPQELSRVTVPMKNGLLSNNGCVEASSTISGTVLATSRPAEGIRITVDVNAAGGKKPVEWVKAELQMVLMTDHFRNGAMTQTLAHNRRNVGDQYQDGKQLKTCTESEKLSNSTLIAQGTMSPGYVENQAGGLSGCHYQSFSRWNTTLSGTKVAVGSSGRFTGTVMLDTSNNCMPTMRSEHCQINWRIAITLDNCSKSIYMPVVLVDTVQDLNTARLAGAAPWFHHEKYVSRMHDGQQYEVPALGTVVNTYSSDDEGDAATLPNYF